MLRAGLIGLPSTGKTTLFRLMTRRSAAAAPRRADAALGVAIVPDERLDRLAALFRPRKPVPATVALADLGGAARARTLLDLAAYREAAVLLHVVRAFEADHVPHVHGACDPARDAREVEDELILADLAVAERRLERLERDRRKGASTGRDLEAGVLAACQRHLENGRPLRSLPLDPAAAGLLRGFQFLSAKPLLLVVNVGEEQARTATAAALGPILAEPHTRSITVCAQIETEIAALDPEDAVLFLADLGLDTPGLTRIMRATYELLGYISFFTVGPDECRAWSIPRGTTAQTAAGAIHSDIERGFIRAEVVSCAHLLARGSHAACRSHGEVRLEGKDYVVRDGDVLNVRFAT